MQPQAVLISVRDKKKKAKRESEKVGVCKREYCTGITPIGEGLGGFFIFAFVMLYQNKKSR